MAEHRDVEAFGVARVYEDGADLLSVAQAEVSPRAPAVGRFIDAVAGREVGSL